MHYFCNALLPTLFSRSFYPKQLTSEDNRSNQNQQKSNNMQVLWQVSPNAVHIARFCFCFFVKKTSRSNIEKRNLAFKKKQKQVDRIAKRQLVLVFQEKIAVRE